MSANSRLINLQEKIQQIQTSLSAAKKSETIPELIESTNLLRSNEFLTKVNQKQHELLSTYEEYVYELKKMISANLRAQINSLRKSQKNSTTPKRKVTKRPRKKTLHKQKIRKKQTKRKKKR